MSAEQLEQLQEYMAEKERNFIRALIATREGKRKQAPEPPNLALEGPKRGPMSATEPNRGSDIQ